MTIKTMDLAAAAVSAQPTMHAALEEILRQHREEALQLSFHLLAPLLKLNSAEQVEAARATVLQLALEIADEAAQSDIECHCVWTSEDPEDRWFNTASIDDEDREKHLRVFVDRAVEYLSLRGILMRHAAQGHLVRFKVMA